MIPFCCSRLAIRSLFLVMLLVSGLTSRAQSPDEVAVRTVMAAQENAWNKGNLEDFMEGYWKNDSLMFVGKAGITYGWQNTLDHYKKGYPNRASMGKLHFSILHSNQLAPDYYFVVGKWHLQRSPGNLEGYYTLLFRKMNGHWSIIVDHTS